MGLKEKTQRLRVKVGRPSVDVVIGYRDKNNVIVIGENWSFEKTKK